MKKELKMFSSHQEADAADTAYYASITPAARLEILFELIDRHRKATGHDSEGFARVCRVIELSQS